MQIKIQCSCETRYAFDVEPVNGRMPVRVNCPSCGADGTEFANAVIQQELGRSLESRPKVRIGTQAAPPPAPAAPPPAALPPASEMSPATAAPEAVQYCPKHRQEPATALCFVCQKPICPKCLEQFGYLCSVYCQNQAVQHRLPVPVYEGQKAVVQQKERRKEKRILAGAALALLAVVVVWGWYA